MSLIETISVRAFTSNSRALTLYAVECVLYPWWHVCPSNKTVITYFRVWFPRSQAVGNFSCNCFSCSHNNTAEDSLMFLLRWMMWRRDITWLGWIFGTCAFHIWASLEIAVSKRRDNLWLSRGPGNFMVTLGSTCHPAGYSYLQNQRQPGEILSRACPVNWAKESTKVTKSWKKWNRLICNTDSNRRVLGKPTQGNPNRSAQIQMKLGQNRPQIPNTYVGWRVLPLLRFSASLLHRQSGKTSPTSAALKIRGVVRKILKREELYGKYKGDFSKLVALAQILLKLKPVYLWLQGKLRLTFKCFSKTPARESGWCQPYPSTPSSNRTFCAKQRNACLRI